MQHCHHHINSPILQCINLNLNFASTHFFLCFFVTANGLKCYCAVHLDRVPVPSQCVNGTCEDADFCSVNLQFVDRSRREIFDCLHNIHDILASGTACTIADAKQVVQCCNDSDYCNRYLNPSLPTTMSIQTPVPTARPTPDNNKGNGGRDGGKIVTRLM